MPAMFRHITARSRRRNRSPRGGYLYIAVLFTSLLVVVSVAGALAHSTAILRRQNDRADRMLALRLAESEMQRQAAIMQRDSQWRNGSVSGSLSDWRSVTPGQVRHRWTDTDGDLADDPFDPVDLVVHARVRNSEAAVAARVESRLVPIDALRYAVTTARDLDVNSVGRLSAERPVQCGDDCNIDSAAALIAPRIEVGDEWNVSGMVRGDTATANVQFPDPELLDLYSDVCTEINVWSLSDVDGARGIEEVVLAAGTNPYGSTDPGGRYWIDAADRDVVIRNCRIDGTLVITNADSLTISGGIHWTAPNLGQPALLTDTDIRIEDLTATLDESLFNVSFNPPGAPDRAGKTNQSAQDVYPTEIRGLIYTPDRITLRRADEPMELRIEGAVLCRRFVVKNPLNLFQADELLEQPPLGFRDPLPKQFARGSIRRVASP